jgi:hypothetical protein
MTEEIRWDLMGGAFPKRYTWEREGQELIGRIVEVKKVDFRGQERMVAVIETPEGDEFSVWLTKQLEAIAMLPMFSLVRIVYLGEQKIKGGRRVKQYKIYVARESKPEPF